MGERVKAVAVDFDGVIHAYSKGWQDGSIYDDCVPYAFPSLNELMSRYAVFVLTSRDPFQVATWLSDVGFTTVVDVEGPDHPPRKFWDSRGKVLVTNRKLPAVAYIDDRGIRFESWDQALSALAKHEEG